VRQTYSNYGDRRFAAAGPKLWNSLPLICNKLTLAFSDFNGY